MSVLSSRPALRWTVPALVVVAALGSVTAGRALTADASPSLPPRTAAQLLVDLQTADPDGFSGTVVQRADLGLPELPTVGGQGSSNFNALVSGSHTLRVYYGGESKQRVALLGTLGESDIIRNGRDVWTWSSDENKATHRLLPARSTADGRHGAPDPARPGHSPTALPSTPQEAAEQALAAIDPTTKVATRGTATVAGRPAYELMLSPRDTASRIGQVRLAVDATEHIPLRVQVFAKDARTAAFEVGFTKVSFARPGDEHFRFTPPPGVTVTEVGPERAAKPDGTPDRDAKEPRIVGRGWTAVVVAENVDLASMTGAPGRDGPRSDGSQSDGPGRNGQLDAVLEALPRVSGAWGSGRLLTSKLFTVLLTDDGRLLAGAVTPQRLYEAAAR